MDFMLAAIGVAKVVFGLLVGVVGINLAARLVKRLNGFTSVDDSLRDGNVAIAIVLSGALLSMGIMARHAVTGTFGALDLLRYQADNVVDLLWVLGYAVVHVSAALAIASAVLTVGVRSFLRLTPDVDEITEICNGNVASALVLAAMMVVLAMLAQQGLETVLDALLPLPTLGRDVVPPG